MAFCDILACGALALPVRERCLVSGWGPSLSSQMRDRPQQLDQAPVDQGANVSSTQRNPAATNKLLYPSGPHSHSCEMVSCEGVADMPGTRSQQACQQLFSSILVLSFLPLPSSITTPCPTQPAGRHTQPVSHCSTRVLSLPS